MKYRQLGHSDLRVRTGVGSWLTYAGIEQEQAKSLCAASLQGWHHFFDTANIYGRSGRTASGAR